MNKRGQIDVWHVIWGLAIVGIVVWLIWSASHTSIKNQQFQSGSRQTNINHINKNYALASLSLALLPLQFHGCVRADKLEADPEQVGNEAIDTAQLINSVSNEVKP